MEISKFFTKSNYDFIGVEFNYEELAKVTSQKFAEELESHTLTNYIKRATVSESGHFFVFYVEDMEGNFLKLIKGYYANHEHGEHFTFEVIRKSELADMGIKLIKE